MKLDFQINEYHFKSVLNPYLFILRLATAPETANSSDFMETTEDFFFIPGDTGQKSATIEIIDDQEKEPTEKFSVFLSSESPVVTVGKPVTVSIIDNDGR